MDNFNFLALSGSLRKDSYNTAVIKALKQFALPHAEIELGNIADLPLFNPDREGEVINSLVNLKSLLSVSDGLIIASPEYAHGISGPLKNALDWLVSGEEFPDIPIMLINTSPRASHAFGALQEVLKTMSGNLVENSFVSVPLLGSELDSYGIVAHPEISAELQSGLNHFCSEVRALNLIQ